MAIYRYPNYATIYNAVVDGTNMFHTHERRACYGESLSRLNIIRNTVKYSILLITSDTFYTNTNYNNYCLMTKHQLECYLRRISTIKHFTYKVSTSEFNGYPCHKIDLKISGTKKEITFVLQCIKRTYEWPYNFYLSQAYELQKLHPFKRESILNLFNVAASAFTNSYYTDHCFSINCKFEKYETLRQRLPHIVQVVDLFPDRVNTTVRTSKIKNITFNGDIPCNTEQWGRELCKAILPTYIKNYQKLKR